MATEQLADMLAEKIGMDPLEFRYQNTYWPGTTMTSGCTMDVHPFPTLIEMMRPKYQAAKERAKKESTPEKKRGVGLAFGMYDSSFSCNDFCEVTLELNPDDSVTLYCGWHDMGQGADAGALVLASTRPSGRWGSRHGPDPAGLKRHRPASATTGRPPAAVPTTWAARP